MGPRKILRIPAAMVDSKSFSIEPMLENFVIGFSAENVSIVKIFTIVAEKVMNGFVLHGESKFFENKKFI